MKVLFIVGGNSSRYEIPPMIKSQGESLKNMGLSVEYFTIIGKGVTGYLSNLYKLRITIQNDKIDIIHAHYSYSGLLAKLTFVSTPIIISYMGSDVLGGGFLKNTILFFEKILFKNNSIVKSIDLNERKNVKSRVIPNGVNIFKFKPLDQLECQKKIDWSTNKTHLLFAANPFRPEKNFKLTKSAVEYLDNENIVLHYLDGVKHEDIPIFMNAANVILLSSIWEGSPNVIKEAMACNRPIVCTKVGDVLWLLDCIEGCYISKSTIEDFARHIQMAIEFSIKKKSTEGREKIKLLELDEENVAKKITSFYSELL